MQLFLNIILFNRNNFDYWYLIANQIVNRNKTDKTRIFRILRTKILCVSTEQPFTWLNSWLKKVVYMTSQGSQRIY